MVGIHPPIPVIPKPMEGRVRDGQRGDTEERVPLSVREGFPLQAMPSARTTSSMALSDSPTHAPHSPDKPSIPSLTLPTSPEQRSNPLFYAASGGGVSMLSAGTYTTSSTARSDEGGGTGTGTFPTEQKTHPGTIASAALRSRPPGAPSSEEEEDNSSPALLRDLSNIQRHESTSTLSKAHPGERDEEESTQSEGATTASRSPQQDGLGAVFQLAKDLAWWHDNADDEGNQTDRRVKFDLEAVAELSTNSTHGVATERFAESSETDGNISHRPRMADMTIGGMRVSDVESASEESSDGPELLPPPATLSLAAVHGSPARERGDVYRSGSAGDMFASRPEHPGSDAEYSASSFPHQFSSQSSGPPRPPTGQKLHGLLPRRSSGSDGGGSFRGSMNGRMMSAVASKKITREDLDLASSGWLTRDYIMHTQGDELVSKLGALVGIAELPMSEQVVVLEKLLAATGGEKVSAKVPLPPSPNAQRQRLAGNPFVPQAEAKKRRLRKKSSSACSPTHTPASGTPTTTSSLDATARPQKHASPVFDSASSASASAAEDPISIKPVVLTDPTLSDIDAEEYTALPIADAFCSRKRDFVSANKKGLIIGVTYERLLGDPNAPPSRLSLPRADVEDAVQKAEWMLQSGGAATKVLLESPMPEPYTRDACVAWEREQPTASNINLALDLLVSGCMAGDVLYLIITGRPGGLVGSSGLTPCDTHTEIPSSTFESIFARIPKGCVLYVVCDLHPAASPVGLLRHTLVHGGAKGAIEAVSLKEALKGDGAAHVALCADALEKKLTYPSPFHSYQSAGLVVLLGALLPKSCERDGCPSKVAAVAKSIVEAVTVAPSPCLGTLLSTMAFWFERDRVQGEGVPVPFVTSYHNVGAWKDYFLLQTKSTLSAQASRVIAANPALHAQTESLNAQRTAQQPPPTPETPPTSVVRNGESALPKKAQLMLPQALDASQNCPHTPDSWALSPQTASCGVGSTLKVTEHEIMFTPPTECDAASLRGLSSLTDMQGAKEQSRSPSTMSSPRGTEGEVVLTADNRPSFSPMRPSKRGVQEVPSPSSVQTASSQDVAIAVASPGSSVSSRHVSFPPPQPLCTAEFLPSKSRAPLAVPPGPPVRGPTPPKTRKPQDYFATSPYNNLGKRDSSRQSWQIPPSVHKGPPSTSSASASSHPVREEGSASQAAPSAPYTPWSDSTVFAQVDRSRKTIRTPAPDGGGGGGGGGRMQTKQSGVTAKRQQAFWDLPARFDVASLYEKTVPEEPSDSEGEGEREERWSSRRGGAQKAPLRSETASTQETSYYSESGATTTSGETSVRSSVTTSSGGSQESSYRSARRPFW